MQASECSSREFIFLIFYPIVIEYKKSTGTNPVSSRNERSPVPRYKHLSRSAHNYILFICIKCQRNRRKKTKTKLTNFLLTITVSFCNKKNSLLKDTDILFDIQYIIVDYFHAVSVSVL